MDVAIDRWGESPVMHIAIDGWGKGGGDTGVELAEVQRRVHHLQI